MGICKKCYAERCRRRDMANPTRPISKMARYTSKSTPVPMPKEKSAPVEKPKPKCTCTPRRFNGYVAHSALCMIFAHNQLDGIRRSSSLDEEATKYGG